ncbi:hypothetical protein M404DRAFT_996744 [Pisolithus tinctorius Marx 270]|uniref:Uncharacterized protein n=1 Tax=Pisolithus tinctorius Marx 270 TaxID=870435 RepID=A0A0C3PK66_PISTI|nr:hypothetical protein M404DRAFT_996744 [Pisolithus tinctorius Marx 270]
MYKAGLDVRLGSGNTDYSLVISAETPLQISWKSFWGGLSAGVRAAAHGRYAKWMRKEVFYGEFSRVVSRLQQTPSPAREPRGSYDLSPPPLHRESTWHLPKALKWFCRHSVAQWHFHVNMPHPNRASSALRDKSTGH